MEDSRAATKLRKKQAALVHGANRRLLPFVIHDEDAKAAAAAAVLDAGGRSSAPFTAIVAIPRDADGSLASSAWSPPMLRPPLPHEGLTATGWVVDVIVLNGGEQSSVDPNALRAAIRHACSPYAGLEVASMTTRGDWAFARVALRVPREGHADLLRLLQHLMSSASGSTGIASHDDLPCPLQLGVLAAGCTPAVVPALFATYTPSAALGIGGTPMRGAAGAAAVPVAEVPGLFVAPHFVPPEDEAPLLEAIGWPPPRPAGRVEGDAVPWEALRGGRNVLHHGKRFCYGSNSWSDEVPPLPDSAADALARLAEHVSDGVTACLGQGAAVGCTFDQCTVNDYPGAGVGIPAHVDDFNHFGPVIAVVSLAAAVVMTWTPPGAEPSAAVPVLLPQGSLAVFTGPARFEWTHAIHERAADVLMFDPAGCSGATIRRKPRCSITFRQATQHVAKAAS